MSQREALLSAAGRLLWERGYESMSPKAILREAGAGQGSMYHHFSGKKDLAIQAINEQENELWDRTAELLDGRGLSPVETWLSASRNALAGCRLGRLANEQCIRTDTELRAPLARYFTRLHEMLRTRLIEARDCGEMSIHLKTGDLASMLIAVVQGGYVLAMANQDPEYLESATSAALVLLRAAPRYPNNTDEERDVT